MFSEFYLKTGLKGLGMGIANVIPGVSGGTIALLTGIYSTIVDSVNSLTEKDTWGSLLHGRFREFWKKVNGGFLVALGFGILLSIVAFAKLMVFILGRYPILTWAFFFGLIMASSYYMLRGIRDFKGKDRIPLIAGAVAGVVVCTLTPAQTPDDLWFIFICGAVSICTMILPGISGSFVLVLLGKYEYIFRAIDFQSPDWPVLIAFGLGCLVGVLAFAKFLHWLLGRWEKQTLLALIGFVLGSLVKIWPWADTESAKAAQILRTGSADVIDLQIPWAMLSFLAGCSLVIVLEHLANRGKSRNS